MKIKLYLLVFLFGYFNVSGQQVDSDSLINEIKLKITKYFIEQGYLDKTTVKNNLNYIFVTEINEAKIIGYNTTGIYRIGTFTSHTPQHILIKEKSSYRIFDIKGIDILLKEIVDYTARNKIEKNLMVLYIKNVISMYEDANKVYTELLKTQ